MITINVAQEFTATPGGRYKSDGDYSGELFRETILEPRYREARALGVPLLVDLDGGYGYPVSWLEEAFGELARKYGRDVLSIVMVKSEEQPELVGKVVGYMEATDEAGITPGLSLLSQNAYLHFHLLMLNFPYEEGDHMYELTRTDYRDTYIGDYITYGISCTGGAVADVSPDRGFVEGLVELFNRNELSPVHLTEVLEDLL